MLILMRTLCISLFLSLCVSLCATWMDYRVNPSEIFHKNGDTQWTVVFETFASWFVPGVLMIAPVAIIVLAAISRSKNPE